MAHIKSLYLNNGGRIRKHGMKLKLGGPWELNEEDEEEASELEIADLNVAERTTLNTKMEPLRR